MDDRPDDLSEHPDLGETAAAMRAAWRAEQEAATRDAVEDWAHRRTLEDRLRASMHRGDEVTVAVGDHRVVGTVEEVGADLLALRTHAGRVDVHVTPAVAMTLEVSARAREGGHRGTDVAGGRFRNALVAREREARVALGTASDPHGIEGAIVVGADHVALQRPDGPELLVRTSEIAWISLPRR
jgi:hypothetical protein